MGHGGTLDPEATGVLILGLGSGTKSLQDFLGCSKSYECVVLFGAATDSYDGVGKIVGRKLWNGVTRERVEQALEGFRGKIMQKPPVFSALRMDGKRLYEYAREGKELPKAIEKREVEVRELEVVEWMDGGSHEFNWPEKEATEEEKAFAEKVLNLGAEKKGEEDASEGAPAPDAASGEKRKREDGQDAADESANASSEPSVKRGKTASETIRDSDTHHTSTATLSEPEPCPAPAVRLRMEVTSGFYVRSLAQDLGQAVGSLGLMASLVRTRQGDFELGKNVLEYEELQKSEDVWGPRVKDLLESWQAEKAKEGRVRERTPPRNDIGKTRPDRIGRGYSPTSSIGTNVGPMGVEGSSVASRRRRNTSSDED